MLYVIDGYNLFFYLDLDPGELQASREQLIDRLKQFVNQGSDDFIVVFDGREEGDPESLGRMRVVFSKDADQYIKDLTQTRKKAEEVIVVSSDKAILHIAKGTNAKTMKCNQFLEKMNRHQQTSTQDLKPHGSSQADYERWLKLFER